MIDWGHTAGLASLFAAISAAAALVVTGRWGGVVVDLGKGTARASLRPDVEPITFAVAWAAGFIILSGGAMTLAAVHDKGRSSAEAAGWAQASGGLLAVLAVILVDRLAALRRRREARDDERSLRGPCDQQPA